MKNQLLTLFFLFFHVFGFAQESSNLRKISMKSHVILAGHYHKTAHYTNDYTLEELITITDIDTMIINETAFKPEYKIRVPQAFDNYPLLWGADCICGMSDVGGIDNGKRYSNLLFLRKNGKQYELVGGIGALEWNNIQTNFIPAIQKIKAIQKIGNLNERYAKTIDWCIENNDYPDSHFIGFYQQQGIIKDTLYLTEEQRVKAKDLFLKGNENIYPFIENHFKTEINTYYLNKLKKIRKEFNLTYFDYREFQKVIEMRFDFDYKDIHSFVNEQLTSDNVSIYDKEKVMDYFIEMLEQDLAE